MAGNEKPRFVQHITSRDVNFSQWYTDVVTMADLMDYAPVRGCMAIKPYGYGIWELIQKELDSRFKATGHENISMPMLIPESLLKKEAAHVEGFAPEVAWVTQGGAETLQERLAIRPTSETLFCTMYAKWLQSWRDLPMKYNQWCSVMRWEKTTRPFLRTAEFLWQEGHTIHATPEEAQEETLQMLDVYREFAENAASIPVYCGKKSDKEKFAGAAATYSIEAMMQDGKALQAGTTHNFGTNFTQPFEVRYLDKDGALKYAYETSWGLSTRMIGAIIMTHGDERGLKLPPKLAPVQVVIVPVAAHKPGVSVKAGELYSLLTSAGLRVKLDDRDYVSPGWKFNEWELKGVPVRLEIGPRDIENSAAVAVRRDNFVKQSVPFGTIHQDIPALLNDIGLSLLDTARTFRDQRTVVCADMEALASQVNGGYAKSMWCGERACEDRIKELTAATSRNMPFDQTPVGETCVCCGRPAQTVMYFAKAY